MPIKFIFNLILPPVFTFDVGPNFQQNLQQLGAKLVSAITDLQAQFDAKLAEAMQASADEHTQVMDAISALQGQLAAALANASTPDEIAAFGEKLNTGFDSLKNAIGGVFEPDQPPAPPAP